MKSANGNLITTILFDYGGVLQTPLDEAAVAARRERLARRLGFADGRSMWNRFYAGEEWQKTKTGAMTDKEMWAALLAPHGLETRAQQADFVRELYRGEGLQPGMKQLLTELGSHYRLGILSNASDTLESLLRDWLGIADRFDVIINSHRIGVAKPHARAYLEALKRLEARPEQVLFIDDQERNTAVAKALGFATHHFIDLATLRADLASRALINQ